MQYGRSGSGTGRQTIEHTQQPDAHSHHCPTVWGMRIDLHTHSTWSDGTDSPAELVAAAVAAGLDVIALTDHDVMSGWGEAGRAGLDHGLTVVPGIEISCSIERISVHLLAYFPDPDHPALVAELTRARDSRSSRLRRMTELIAADGYPIDHAQVQARAAPGATLGRPHLADALVAAGVVPDRSAAFADLLASNGPYYVTHYALDPVHAVEVVTESGGVPVMAHPFASARGRVVTDRVIEQMTEAGLFGLEAHHRDHTAAGRRHALELAGRLGLQVTGSSDYHGTGKPNRPGEHTTAPDVFEAILERGSGAPMLGAPLR